METVKINISDFASAMGFCQFIVVNKYHLGMKKVDLKRMELGKLIHWKLEKEEQLLEREEATSNQLKDKNVDMNFTREGVTVALERVNQIKFRYMGRLDKVQRRAGNLYILDDKVTSKERPKLFENNILQLSAYCEAFTYNYSYMLAFDRVFFKAIFRDTEGKVIREHIQEFTPGIRDFLKINFQIFEGLYQRNLTPEHHNQVQRCLACGYLDCKERLRIDDKMP